MWYLWKARDTKCFSNEDTTPLDTLHLACHEAETWKMAQIVETNFTEEENNQPIDLPLDSSSSTSPWRCQVDASWSESSDGTGMVFVLYEMEIEVLTGQCRGPQTESPLHAEAESLCWAMNEVSRRGLSRVNFESDFQQLVHIIQMEKQWPALEPELDEIGVLKASFKFFNLAFVPRNANVRADGLAKNARSRVQSDSHFEVKDPLRLAIETCLYGTV